MLSSIRNNRKALSIVLWLVIIAFVATIFVVWGVGEKSNTLGYVAKVNDKIITYEEYQNRYKMADDEIRRYGGAVQIDNLSKRILESLVNEKLMLIEAEKLDIPATDLELVSYIRSIPSFQLNGEFNIDQYEMVLRNNGLNPEQYEKAVKDEIKMRKMTNLIYQTQSIATDKEIENEYNYRKSNITVDYAAIPLNTFEKNIPANPDDAALKEYYDLTKEVYRVPAEIKVKYVSFDKNKFLSNYTVSDEQAKAYYDNNAQLYDKKESAASDTCTRGIAIYHECHGSCHKHCIQFAPSAPRWRYGRRYDDNILINPHIHKYAGHWNESGRHPADKLQFRSCSR